ncbi:metallophosphoesterase family protein [bacterium]|nr:metallophosphoesterase family protein [bacterium]
MNISVQNKKLIFIIAVSFIAAFGLKNTCSAQTITKGPYLADPGRNSITIRWESDKKTECSVFLGKNSSLYKKNKAEIIGNKDGFYLYESKLTGLMPGTEYFYQVKCGSVKSIAAHFKTAPSANQPFDFVAMGDSRSHQDVFHKIMKNAAKFSPDLIISMGDLVADGGNFAQWKSQFFDVAGKVVDHVPFISTLGDHEGDGDNGKLFRYFLLPHLNVDSLWFSFDFGNAHFVSLDYRHPYDKNMIEWFKKDMAGTEAEWKFVFTHRPCYNLGGHRSTWGRAVWPDLFSKFKVDIVFAGHSHQYERFFPVKPLSQVSDWPVTYITTGGAGAGLYEISRSAFLAKVESIHHFINFKINGDTLSLKTISLNDSVFDKLLIIKNNGKYSNKYLSVVKPREQLDVYTMFLRAISPSINKIPLEDIPATAKINLKSNKNLKDIKFTISLSPESEKFYKMDTVEGILHKNDKMEIPLQIFSETDMTISNWGDIKPDLRLEISYTISGIKKKITGGRIEYWPDDL